MVLTQTSEVFLLSEPLTCKPLLCYMLLWLLLPGRHWQLSLNCTRHWVGSCTDHSTERVTSTHRTQQTATKLFQTRNTLSCVFIRSLSKKNLCPPNVVRP